MSVVTPELCLDTTRALGIALPPNPHAFAQKNARRWELARAVDTSLGLIGSAFVGLEAQIGNFSEKELRVFALKMEQNDTRNRMLIHIQNQWDAVTAMSGVLPAPSFTGLNALGFLRNASDANITLIQLETAEKLIDEDKGAAQLLQLHPAAFNPQ